jgi:fumarate reductase flavoprotein subunit
MSADKDGGGLIYWVEDAPEEGWDVEVDILVIGAGGCGLVAGLTGAQQGLQVLVVEKEAAAGGNTSLGQGMFPAVGSAAQKRAGIDDSPELMTGDILKKNDSESDPELTREVVNQTGRLVDWLHETEGIELELVTNFLYPGHSRHLIHAPKTTKGSWLVNRLLEASHRYDNLDIAYGSSARRLIARRPNGAVLGAEVEIRGEGINRARAKKTILALSGFGANREMIKKYIPEMENSYYFGHQGNSGEGILWGEALGAELVNMSAYQAHGSVAHPHGCLLTWAVISLGGYQVNRSGKRFVNEDHGYSEHALDVLAQEGEVAIEIFDQRIFDEVKTYDDFQQCVEMGAVKSFPTIEALAHHFQLDPAQLAQTHEAFQRAAADRAPDPLGRTGFVAPLQPPYYGVQVTGALFHTQGGLKVDNRARVIRKNGEPVPNLFAGGGTAAGFSGSKVSGYLSANGLLAALTLGLLAGEEAGRSIQATQ